jgi:hypothetical protein
VIDRKKLEELQQRAAAQVSAARERVGEMFRQPVPPHIQLATYKALVQNPQKLAEYQARYGADKWREYATAMQEIEKTLGGLDA